MVAYLVLGAVVGLAIGSLSDAGRDRRLADGHLIEPIAGAFGSTLVYSLSTSVWANRAASQRIPGTAVDPITLLNYVLWDHPIVCAVVVSASVSLLFRVVLSIGRGARSERRG